MTINTATWNADTGFVNFNDVRFWLVARGNPDDKRNSVEVRFYKNNCFETAFNDLISLNTTSPVSQSYVLSTVNLIFNLAEMFTFSRPACSSAIATNYFVSTTNATTPETIAGISVDAPNKIMTVDTSSWYSNTSKPDKHFDTFFVIAQSKTNPGVWNSVQINLTKDMECWQNATTD